MITFDQYRFSRSEIARCRCNDCGVNVIKIGDYCLLTLRIWEDQFGLGPYDNLCIACIEKRLGRKLTWLADFIGFPVVEGYPMSDTLLDRYGFSNALAKEKARKRARRKARRS